MPEEGIKQFSHQEILSFEEIVDVVKIAVNMGIDKFRITGGEPLVRKGIIDLISMISQVEGVRDFSMTSNGILLESMAKDLKLAGLHRINISLDTLDPKEYKIITRGGDLNKVLIGINAAQKAGLNPIKLNCVIEKSSLEPNAQMVKEFADKNNLSVRFITKMSLETGEFSIVEGGEGGHCTICNRLRLSANGYIMPCLFNDQKFNIRQLGIENAFLLAIKNKPPCGEISKNHDFFNIGG